MAMSTFKIYRIIYISSKIPKAREFNYTTMHYKMFALMAHGLLSIICDLPDTLGVKRSQSCCFLSRISLDCCQRSWPEPVCWEGRVVWTVRGCGRRRRWGWSDTPAWGWRSTWLYRFGTTPHTCTDPHHSPLSLDVKQNFSSSKQLLFYK